MEDLETSAALEFHGVAYVVTVHVQQQALALQVEVDDAASSGGLWTGRFPAAHVEELTRQTGNSKRFSVFVHMLLSALARRSDAVFVDLLTAADLALYRQRKLGTATPGPLSVGKDGADGAADKRYLILTYAVAFDRVHYPLPLAPVLSPSPEVLQRTIRRLRRALADVATGSSSALGQQSAANGTALEEENAALREENRCLKNTLAQYCDGEADRQSAPIELQRELQASIDENKELIALYQQFREDSAAETARLRAEIKQLRLASQQDGRIDQTKALEQEQERLEMRRKIKDSNAAVQETLAQMLQMKAQVEETQLKNRELLRQLAVARARAGQQQTPRQPRPSPTPSRSSHVSSRFSTTAASSSRQARLLGASRQPQAKDTLFPTPFRSSASHYGPSDDEDDAKSARRGRSQAQTRSAFRRFDPTAYQQEKERKLRAARARSNSRSRPPRSNGGYTSDSSAGGYSSADSRGSKGSARSTRSRGRAASRTSVERQREIDARLASPKKSVEPSPVETRRPRAANKMPLPRSGAPRSRPQSRGRSPSPAPSINSNGRGPVGVTEPSPARLTSQKPRQTPPATRRRKPLPQELLDTSVDSFSDIDDRLTALQQFLREAKQGGAAAAPGAGTAA